MVAEALREVVPGVLEDVAGVGAPALVAVTTAAIREGSAEATVSGEDVGALAAGLEGREFSVRGDLRREGGSLGAEKRAVCVALGAPAGPPGIWQSQWGPLSQNDFF